MTNGNRKQEICDLNLTYLLLAQRMLKTDRARALLQLGISSELADMLLNMSLSQTLRLATSDQILCSFRLADLPIARSIVCNENEATAPLQQVHLSIVFAGKMARATALAVG